MEGTVYFIGAGPGDPDLLTVKARRLIGEADLILFADSLVSQEITLLAKPDAQVEGSSVLHLEEIVKRMVSAARSGRKVARLHSGDPSIYGAIHEQIRLLKQAGVPYEIIPGVSSVFAAAARLGVELTVPGITQTVIFTRSAGNTSMPARETIRSLASHGATLAIFLSVLRMRTVVQELRAGGYPEETPVAVLYRVSWPDEAIVQGTLADIIEKVRKTGWKRQALILIGEALEASGPEKKNRSKLYDPKFTHIFRRAEKKSPPPKAAGPSEDGSSIAFVARSLPGVKLCEELQTKLPASILYAPAGMGNESSPCLYPYRGSVLPLIRVLLPRYRRLALCLPMGIAVRALSGVPLNKKTDPAIVVVEERGRFVIPVLSGHRGGGNELAKEIASLTGGEAVITTAAEVHESLAVDLLGSQWGWIIASPENVTAVSAAVLNGATVGIYQDSGESDWWPRERPWPGHLHKVALLEELVSPVYQAALVITSRSLARIPQPIRDKAVVYYPRSLVVGIGCRKSIAKEEIAGAVDRVFQEHGLAFGSIRKLATADIKRNEPALVSYAEEHGLVIQSFKAEELNRVKPLPNPSAAALRFVGLQGVAEPAALLSAGADHLLVEKNKIGPVTVAVAQVAFPGESRQ